MTDTPPRVFISYAQDKGLVSAWVRDFSKRLEEAGFDPILDQEDDVHPKGLIAWIDDRFRQADWVVCVCNSTYSRYFEAEADTGNEGLGVAHEARLIRNELFANKGANTRIVPILPPSGQKGDVPHPLNQYLHYSMELEFAGLVSRLRHHGGNDAKAAAKNTRAKTPAPDGSIANPYPGLAAFTPEQHELFFGRDEDTAAVVEQLRRDGFASVIGGSGTGKSSLVAAGVLPALRQQAPQTHYLRFKPRTDPLRRLAEAIDAMLPEDKVQLGKARGERIAAALAQAPDDAVRGYLLADAAPLLVFGDQFEELFTQSDSQRRDAFRPVFEALLRHQAIRLVVTLRVEFMAPWMQWLGGQAFARSLVPLDPIRDDARLRRIIEAPAEAVGVPVEPALLDELLPAARALAGALPLLALALQRLFGGGGGSHGMTAACYRAIGGLEGVVLTAVAPIDAAIEADEALAAASERLFAELATVIDGIATRRSADSERLRREPGIATLLDALRAIGFATDPDEGHVELAHESLLLHWPRLRQWCERYADKLALRRQAEHASAEWARAGEGLGSARLHQWGWERQRQALLALQAIHQIEPRRDPDFIDPGIAAWRALEATLDEPLKSFLQPEPLRLLAELSSDDTPHNRREDIGRRLDQMGDPRRGVGLDEQGLPDIAWIEIPAGEVTLESDPPSSFPVTAFEIARYPVTWEQYYAFLHAADGFRDAQNWQGLCEPPEDFGEPKWAFLNHPAIMVSWFDAMAFCAWLTRQLECANGTVIRLPTEWEWQWVAQAGSEAREYPWGKDWQPARVNSFESGIGRTTAVGMYPLGATAKLPVMDLAGNVWEWCLNEYDVPDRVDPGVGASRVLRGGSWGNHPRSCRAAHRDDLSPGNRLDGIGFRVCRGSPIVPPAAAPLDAGSPAR
ncbi:MAG: SUMF1/EgtB/PvdO family nonheme iron enzyme [Rhodocyclaceae bacterium]|nr:SUMF1/EgtB/PvdO family nonheme iron enzyme [Rhodocyclaceae bacterium]